MRLGTHIVFAAGVAAATAALLGCKVCIPYAILASTLVNISIDVLGHEVRAGRPRRTAFSHSLVGPLVFSFPFIYPVLATPATPAILAGAYSHLLLDAVTEGGIYAAWPFKKKRYRLARIRYNNTLANMLAMIAGIMLLAYALA